MAVPPKQPKVAIIMAGGSGTRFWPLSTKKTPKQYVNLIGKRSLIQDTVKRLSKNFSSKNTFIVSTASQKSLLKKQLPSIKNLIFEPEGKNTAPCLMLTVKKLLDEGYPKNTVIGVFPADHTVSEDKAFQGIIEKACTFAAETSGIVTLGIVPESPHTGYGYIEKKEAVSGWDGIYHVSRFKEKPDLETATKYVLSENYYWNAGIFLFRLDTIVTAFVEFIEADWNKLLVAKSAASIKKVYKGMKATPIDIAVLEKSPFVYLIPCKMGWNDVGSWNALSELTKKNERGNYASNASTLFLDCQNNYISSQANKKIAIIGCDNLLVIETNDSLLICAKEKDQLVRDASKKFDK